MTTQLTQKTIKKTYDHLILGSGLAGLFTAIKLAKTTHVALISKDKITESNSSYAQGGIAAALINPDSPQKHYEDTMKAGHYHNNPDAVKILTEEGPNCVRELIELGVKFDQKHNQLHLSKEGAHSEARVLHYKDHTGIEITNTLIKYVKNNPNIDVYESVFIYDLLTKNNTCFGCSGFSQTNHYQFHAQTTILATGGAGQLFQYTSNPAISTGDGLLLGKKSGCILQDMEFIQFHPTSFLFNHKKNHVFLLSEAIRGAGASIENENNEAFMHHYHPDHNLAPRDIVAQAIFKESEHSNIYLNCTKVKNIKHNFPTLYTFCKKHTIDLTTTRCPIHPAAHYMMGGIKTNLNAQTNIDRLYAIGEVACTGVHGANRLASNSLLEAIVFANRAVQHILQSNYKELPQLAFSTTIPTSKTPSKTILKIKSHIQQIMWKQVGIIRTSKGLEKALTELTSYQSHFTETSLNQTYCEIQNLLELSIIVTKSALTRNMPLGSHYTESS
ncbi:L-aspartate oxidase [Candidatus Marinamargulisbacteria bacterium SCGC AG-414-C22]|nr:L-aspartate oxidase [Candidatus Marinamargulisbacteria bacterium SCGC AG-414-C22]